MTQTRSVPKGPWGGNGIRLDVGQSRSTIEYSCAAGEIAGRLKLDSKGSFNATGTHTSQRPGPIREGEKPHSKPARYEGRVSGRTMTLKVILTETNEVIGSFELKQNANVRLHRCL